MWPSFYAMCLQKCYTCCGESLSACTWPWYQTYCLSTFSDFPFYWGNFLCLTYSLSICLPCMTYVLLFLKLELCLVLILCKLILSKISAVKFLVSCYLVYPKFAVVAVEDHMLVTSDTKENSTKFERKWICQGVVCRCICMLIVKGEY
jgi:hypothetical protein